MRMARQSLEDPIRAELYGRVLRESYRVIANAIREERAITPAAEWLVDNFHVVDERLGARVPRAASKFLRGGTP